MHLEIVECIAITAGLGVIVGLVCLYQYVRLRPKPKSNVIANLHQIREAALLKNGEIARFTDQAYRSVVKQCEQAAANGASTCKCNIRYEGCAGGNVALFDKVETSLYIKLLNEGFRHPAFFFEGGDRKVRVEF